MTAASHDRGVLPARLDAGWALAAATPPEKPFEIIRARMGWTSADIEAVEIVTDEKLPDIDIAVELIHEAITSGDPIAVITDYDMDGVAAGLTAQAGLAELGANVHLVVPHYEGPRDVTAGKVTQALEQQPGAKLIISCDVGINSNEGIDAAHHAGARFLVADHHIEGDENCRADAVVDPNRRGCDYPEPEICGSQVVLHILQAYVTAHRPDKKSDIDLLSLFGGIGGLADVMPLRGQTRSLVRRAVALIALALPQIPVYTDADQRRSENPIKWYQVGSWNTEDPDAIDPHSSVLMTLIDSGHHAPAFTELFSGMSLLLGELVAAGKVRSPEDLDPGFLGFTFTPMFNATRRIEGDMADSFKIFAPASTRRSRPDHRKDAETKQARRDSVRQIIANNEARKLLTEEAMAELRTESQPMAPYVWFSSAAAGVLGLLASNLVEESGLPAVVVNPETLNGSARAPEWIDVLGTVAGLDRPGLFAGGHHQACGVRAREREDLQRLAQAFDEQVQRRPEPTPEQLRADLHMIDIGQVQNLSAGVLDDVDLSLPDNAGLVALAELLSQFEPYGRGFPEPDIRITFQPEHATLALMSPRENLPEPSGDDDEDDPCRYKHLSIVLDRGFKLLWWNSAEQRDALAAARLATATVSLSVNSFAGNLRPQAYVRHMELH